MKKTNMPGFTAEAALYKTIGQYRALASASGAMAAAALAPALPPPGGGIGWVDCNEPFAYYCAECGGTGPGTIRCCRTDACVVIDRQLAGGVFAY